MTPELEKFIDLAIRPLKGKDAQSEEARGELMGRLSHQGVPVERIDLAGPTARLGSAKPFPAAWRRGLVLGALLLLLGLFLFGLWRDGWMSYRAITAQQLGWQELYGFGGDSGDPDPFQAWLDRKAPDLPIRGRAGEIPMLRRNHPEDLGILQEALWRRPIGEAEFMTPEERRLVAGLDPDNALWPLLEMVWEFHKASGAEMHGFGYKAASLASDPAAEERGWRRFSEAVKLDHFRSHGPDLLRWQRDAYGADRSVLDGMIFGTLSNLPRSAGKWLLYRGNSQIIERMMQERAESLSDPGSEDRLLEFFADWKKLQRLVSGAETPDPLALDLMTGASEKVTGAFESGFVRLGMREAGDEAREIGRKLSVSPKPLPSPAPDDAGIRIHEWAMMSPIPATAEEVRPGRKAEMAMFHRLLTWPLVLGALAFVLMWGFEACRRPPEVKGMACGLLPLLTSRDHRWIGIFGIAVPWLYFLGATRFTPVGISDKVFANDAWVALAWVLQIAIGMVLGLVMLTHAVRWRWALRGGFLGLGAGMPWLGRAVAWLVAASLPAAGLIRFLDLADDDAKGLYLMGCAAMGSVGLLWLLWIGIMNLCTPRHGALGSNLVARTMIPWSLAGLATLLLAAGVLRVAEGWWYQRDPLLPNGTSERYANALEERMVADRIERFRRAFGP